MVCYLLSFEGFSLGTPIFFLDLLSNEHFGVISQLVAPVLKPSHVCVASFVIPDLIARKDEEHPLTLSFAMQNVTYQL